MHDVLPRILGKNEEDAKTEIAERFLRAENGFFQDHWQCAHPDEAAERIRHIAVVTRLARVTAYHKRVLVSRFEGIMR